MNASLFRNMVHALFWACALLPQAAQAQGGAPSLVVDFVLTRISNCIAPCYVFADATAAGSTIGTTSSATQLPFHEIEYTWNFGDPASGTWSYGARPGVNSKNVARGPIAAHVFEAPGTYTITLTATDGVLTGTRQATVTVTDPGSAPEFAGAKTVCISNTTDFAGCPATAKRVSGVANLSQIATEVAAGGRRILFRRGHTWTVSSTVNVYVRTNPDPGLIGAFGTGADPVWQAAPGFPAGSAMFNISSIYGKSMKDWRIMDIKLDGNLVPTPKSLHGIQLFGGIDQLTLLRITADSITIPILGSYSLLDIWNGNATHKGHHMWDQLAIVDFRQLNTPHGCYGCAGSSTGSYPYGIFITAERMAIMGSSFDNLGDSTPGVSHNIRIQYAAKFRVSDNDIARPGPSSHVIKLHSSDWKQNPESPNDVFAYTPPTGVTGSGQADAGVPPNLGNGITRWGYIADNKIISGVTPYPIAIGPHSGNVQNRIRDIIFERNWVMQTTPAGGARLLNLEGTYLTARNNLLDLSGGQTHHGIFIGKRNASFNVELPADNVSVYGNTIYGGSSGSGFRGIWIEAGSTNITAKNNLGYAPNDATATMFFGQAANRSGGNTGEVGSVALNPSFVGPLTSVAGWSPAAGSYAKGSGVAMPVWRDFFGAGRSATAPGVGAVE